jgi:hypothetical protein
MPIKLPTRVAENIDRFTGRAWLLPRILEWLDRGDERVLVITGGPGTGKSMILAWLAGFGPAPAEPAVRAQLERMRKAAMAAHFCDVRTRNIGPQAFAESICNQLVGVVPGFYEALQATLADRVHIVATATVQAGSAAPGASITGIEINLAGLGDELSFDRAFTYPLQRLYDRGYGEPMLIVVDALDEAIGYAGGSTLPRLLSRLNDLPDRVKILVSTRPDPRVLAFYPHARRLDLIKDARPDGDDGDDLDADVKDYVAGRLGQTTSLTAASIAEFSLRMATKAKGVFLYAAVVLDDLLPRLPQLPDLDSYLLPKDLGALYEEFLTRELGTDELGKPWERIYGPLLGLLAVARGDGLTAEQLRELIGHQITGPLKACKQYLDGSLPDGPFQLFHKSFADFLLADEDNVQYHIDANEMHAKIAAHGWQKYSADWSQCDVYTLDSLAVHLHEAQDSRLESLISEGWMRARIKGFRFDGFLADVELAWRAASSRDVEHAVVSGIRYALVRASVNSMSRSYPPALAARAFEQGLWTSERVFSLTRNLRDAEAATLWAAVLGTRKLAPDDAGRAEGLAVARAQAIREPDRRARAFANLAGALDGSAKVRVRELALRAAREIRGSGGRVQVLGQLASLSSDEDRDEIILEALRIVNDTHTWMSPWEARSSSAHESDGDRGFVLKELAPLLAPSLAVRALEIATTLADARVRAYTEAALIEQLQDDLREGVAQRVAESVRCDLTSADGQHALEAIDRLTSIARYLSPGARVQLLQDGTGKHRDDEVAFRWAFEVIPILDPHRLADAKQAAERIPDAARKAAAWTSLAKLVPGEHRKPLFDDTRAALRDADALDRLRCLRDWLPLTEGEVKQAAIRDLLDAASEVLRRVTAGDLSVGIVAGPVEAALHDVPQDLVEAALHLALTPQLRAFRDELVKRLAPRLSGELLTRALRIAGEIEERPGWVAALSVLAMLLTGASRHDVLQMALDAFSRLTHLYWRAKAAAALVPVLDGEDRRRVVREGLRAARDSGVFADLALAKLAPWLTVELANAAIDAAMHVATVLPGDRERCLAAVATGLTGDVRTRIVHAVVESLPRFDDAAKWRIMQPLLLSRDATCMTQCWVTAQRFADPAGRVRALLEIAPRLAGDDQNIALQQAVDAVAAITGAFDQAKANASLSAHVTGDVRSRAIASAVESAADIELPAQKLELIALLLPQLADDQRAPMLAEAFALIENAQGSDRGQMLQALVPALSGPALERAATLASGIADVDARAGTLAGIGRRLARQATDPAARRALRRQIGGWLLALGELDRSRLLHFCSECLFDGELLGVDSLAAIGRAIREITEWQFEPAEAGTAS